MPITWTETNIHVSDQIQESISENELRILRSLALNFLEEPKAWIPAGEHFKCPFLARDGCAAYVEIGVATIGNSFATVFSIQMKNGGLANLIVPLKRIDEFEPSEVDTEYRSAPVSGQRVAKIRIGDVRRLRPMEYDPEQ